MKKLLALFFLVPSVLFAAIPTNRIYTVSEVESNIAKYFDAADFVKTSIPYKLRTNLNGTTSVYVNVADYGASVSSEDNGPAFSDAVNSLKNWIGGSYGVVGGKIIVPPGQYQFKTSFTLPSKLAYVSNLEIEGYGAIVYSTNDNIKIFNRWPTNITEGGLIGETKIHIRGFQFRGIDGATNQTGIRMSCTYGGSVKECSFTYFANAGLDVYSALKFSVENCEFTYAKSRFQSGTNYYTGLEAIVGSAINDSQVNHLQIKNCRFYPYENDPYALGLFDASGIHITDCVFEGMNPKCNIFYTPDGMAATAILIENTHWENNCKQAFMVLTNASRFSVVFNVMAQYTTNLVIDARGCDNPNIAFYNCQYFENAPLFNASMRRTYDGTWHDTTDSNTGWVWTLVNCTGQYGSDYRDVKWWVSNSVPSTLTLLGGGLNQGTFAGNGAGLTNITASRISNSSIISGDFNNLLLNSEDMDSTNWTGAYFGNWNVPSVTANGTVSPLSLTNADICVYDGGDVCGIGQTVTNQWGNGSFTFSTWLSAPSNCVVYVGIVKDGFVGTVSGPFTLTNGWVRYSATTLNVNETDRVSCCVYFKPGGVGQRLGNTFYMWGAQLEKSLVAGDYVRAQYSRIINQPTLLIPGTISMSGALNITGATSFTGSNYISSTVVENLYGSLRNLTNYNAELIGTNSPTRGWILVHGGGTNFMWANPTNYGLSNPF